MPGYYLHLSACNPEALKNRSFVLGVEAPDILKAHVKLYGADGAREKYNSLKVEGMPEYCRFAVRAQQKEKSGTKGGFHYGVSSQPDVWAFWNSLTDEEKNNPFYKGYLWHLLTDILMYARLDIDTKYAVVLGSIKDHPDIKAFHEGEIKKLHADWDKTNAKVRATYPDVQLTPEVEELGVVQFIEDDHLDYVDWEIVKSTIDYLRELNPMEYDTSAIEVFINNTLEYVVKNT